MRDGSLCLTPIKLASCSMFYRAGKTSDFGPGETREGWMEMCTLNEVRVAKNNLLYLVQQRTPIETRRT